MTYYVTNNYIYTNDKLQLYYLNDMFKTSIFFTSKFEMLDTLDPVIELNMFHDIFLILNNNKLNEYIESIYQDSQSNSHNLISNLSLAFDYFLLNNNIWQEKINNCELKKTINKYNTHLIANYETNHILPKYLTNDTIHSLYNYINNDNIWYTDCRYIYDLSQIHEWDTLFPAAYILDYIPDFPPGKFPILHDNMITILQKSSDFKYIDTLMTKETFQYVLKNKYIPMWFLDKYKLYTIDYINSTYVTVINSDMLSFIIKHVDIINISHLYIYSIPVPWEFAYKYRHELNAYGSATYWELPNSFYLLDDIPANFFKYNVITSCEEAIGKYYDVIYQYDCKNVSYNFILTHIDKLSHKSLITRCIDDEFAHILADANHTLVFSLCQNKNISMSFIDKYYYTGMLPYMSDLIFGLSECIVDKYYDMCKLYAFGTVQFSPDFYERHIVDLDKFTYIPIDIAIKYNVHNKKTFVKLPYADRICILTA